MWRASNTSLTSPLALRNRAGLSFSEAAAIPETFFTVWANVFQLGKLQPGESILVHGGASGIGTTAVLLCHALGMTVYATVGQDEKIAALRPYATAINYKTDDFAEKIGQLTNDEGVDVILDIVGGPYFNRNLGLLKKDGRLVIIGFMGGRIAHEVDIQTLMLKRATAAEPKDIVGYVREASDAEVQQALTSAINNAPIWFATPPQERAAILERAAVLMESQMPTLMGILVREAGKTFSNAIAEVREAVDFLHYYAGAEQGAKAVEAMHHRQHRFIHLPLDGRAFDVDSDLCRAEAGAEDSQTEGEQRGGSDPQRQAEHQHAKHGEGHGGADDLAGTKALHQPRRAENTAHRPHRQTKQHHAHLCGG